MTTSWSSSPDAMIKPSRTILLRRVAMTVLCATCAILAIACDGTESDANPPLPPRVTDANGGSVTFFIAADTHFGHRGIEKRNRRMVDALNDLPGTDWPTQIGGTVQTPRGVLIAGDLTERGTRRQWEQFRRYYGGPDANGLLRFPAFACTGNHDRYTPWRYGFVKPVLDGVRQQHGGLLYRIDWGQVTVLSLDEYPSLAACRWLAKQLDQIDPTRSIVIFFHYGLHGPFADWWPSRHKNRFEQTIRGHNVVLLAHGHYHASQHYRWRGWDVVNVGSPKHMWTTFSAVRIQHDRLDVASYDWSRRRWNWSFSRDLSPPGTTDPPAAPVEAYRPN
ncbi:MAG: metallophosphoesterase [Planctomycetota bacterium]